MSQVSNIRQIDKRNPPMKRWSPDDDFKAATGYLDFIDDPKRPGNLIYTPKDKADAIRVLDELGRNNPYSLGGRHDTAGQGEFMSSDVGTGEREIKFIALSLPKYISDEGQYTVDFLSDESQNRIAKEAQERHKKGYPDIKNPPCCLESPTSTPLLVSSGNNRNYFHGNKFPGEYQLLIVLAELPVADGASQQVAEILNAAAGNPPPNNRINTRKDWESIIKECIKVDVYLTNPKTGEKINPEGKSLADMIKSDPLWHKIFDFITKSAPIHTKERTQILNLITGNTSGRKAPITEKTKFDDLSHLGWETGVQRDTATKTILPGYKRVDWDEHLDVQNNSLIIVRDAGGSHFDSVVYPIMDKYANDLDWREKLKENNIFNIDFLLSVKGDTHKVTKEGKDKAFKRLQTFRHLVSTHPELSGCPLPRVVCFNRNWNGESYDVRKLK